MSLFSTHKRSMNIPFIAFFFYRGFSVVAPELAVPGKTTAVLVTLHGPTSFQPLNVTLKLYPDPLNGSNQPPIETTQEITGKIK